MFVARFLGIVLAFYLLSLAPFIGNAQTAYLRAMARSANALLRCLGEDSQIMAETIWSSKYSVTIGPQCAALELVWFLSAAMLAFPAPWGRRMAGIVAGAALIAALNTARVGSLYLIGVHAPAWFAQMHENVWPSLLIAATLGLVAGWIGWTHGDEPIGDDVAS